MLNGACRNLLTQVPESTRQQFDEELYNVLCSHSTGRVSMLLLWCFGIVLLAEYPGEAEPLQSAESTFGQLKPTGTSALKRQWKTRSGRKVFGSVEKLHKTMYLTSLSVIWALKDDVGMSEVEATEAVRVAFRTLQCVDRATLHAWPRSSTQAKDVFSKLLSKVSHAGVTSALQLEAVAFYATIAGKGNLPLELVARYERCIGEIANLVDADCLGETLTISLSLFAVSLMDVDETLFSDLTSHKCEKQPYKHWLPRFWICASRPSLPTRFQTTSRLWNKSHLSCPHARLSKPVCYPRLLQRSCKPRSGIAFRTVQRQSTMVARQMRLGCIGS